MVTAFQTARKTAPRLQRQTPMPGHAAQPSERPSQGDLPASRRPAGSASEHRQRTAGNAHQRLSAAARSRRRVPRLPGHLGRAPPRLLSSCARRRRLPGPRRLRARRRGRSSRSARSRHPLSLDPGSVGAGAGPVVSGRTSGGPTASASFARPDRAGHAAGDYPGASPAAICRRSWPQAASMSRPRERRKCATTRRAFSSSMKASSASGEDGS